MWTSRDRDLIDWDGTLQAKNLKQGGKTVIDSSSISSQSVSYAVIAGYASSALVATTNSKKISNNVVTNPSNSTNSGAETELYSAQIMDGFTYAPNDCVEFKFTGIMYPQSQATNFYINLYDNYSYYYPHHLLTLPIDNTHTGGSGQCNWKIEGTISLIALSGSDAIFQIDAQLTFADAVYSNDAIPVTYQLIKTYFGGTTYIYWNPYLSLSVDDDSGVGYCMGTMGLFKKV